jgi:DNA-binding LacI/PurR family transcriptional regulator
MTGSNSATKKTRRVTLADVAAEAGVSVATASVAITGRPSGNCRVSAAVAERIRRAARALNYRPNLQARNLSTQRTHTVALIVKRSNWQNAMFYLSATQRVLRERGYSEIFLLHTRDNADCEREQLENCIDRRVEGIIIMPVIDLQGRTNVDRINEIYQREQIPVVQLSLGLEGCTAPVSMSDEEGSLRLAVRTLYERGHRRIAHVSMAGADDANPDSPWRTAHLRYAGYLAEMKELGLEPQLFMPPKNAGTVDALYDDALRLCPAMTSGDSRPTAITTYSDYTAAGVATGLEDLGLRLPDDMSIIGLGDQTFARMIRPGLTTIAPQYEQIGTVATQMLLKMIDGEEAASVAVPPTLISRQSVAPQ